MEIVDKYLKIIDKYRVHNRLCCGPMSKKMSCVHLYVMAVEGKYPIEDVKQMAGDAPMEKYLLPEDYENWKRLTAED